MNTRNEAAVAARREYQRKWRHKNPDKVKAATDRYWAHKAEREAAEREKEEGSQDGCKE